MARGPSGTCSGCPWKGYWQLLSTQYMPGTMPSTLHVQTHLLLPLPWGRWGLSFPQSAGKEDAFSHVGRLLA